jgi:hypothetical protein
MTNQNARQADSTSVDDDAAPAGTAIVRALRHVKAVRERHAQELAVRSVGAGSRSARAWSWALGETDIAPVTDRATSVPPSRGDIEAEIAEADERQFRGDRDNRADGAATVLRWLIGDDDHLPVQGPNRGELVGGFGDVVRSPGQIADLVASLRDFGPLANGSGRYGGANQHDFRSGAVAALNWVLSRQASSPITAVRASELTTRDLKTERLHAMDLAEGHGASASEGPLSSDYGSGVRCAIDWLLGDTAELSPS